MFYFDPDTQNTHFTRLNLSMWLVEEGKVVKGVDGGKGEEGRMLKRAWHVTEVQYKPQPW